MSVAGGVHNAFARGVTVGCETMQIFTKSERQWKPRPLSEEEVATYHTEQERTGIRPVIVHDSYLINLASPRDELWQKSLNSFAIELERCELLRIPYIVTHPGAHTGSGDAAALARETEAFNRLFSEGIAASVTVLLETTAGQGTALGWTFEHIAYLLENAAHPERLGVCVDTCHIFAAGYDIRTEAGYHQTFARFDEIIGVEHIKAFHLNDSQKGLGSRVDRHAHIGQGEIGLEAFRLLVNDPRFTAIPKIIETPKNEDMAEDIENLTLLRSLVAA